MADDVFYMKQALIEAQKAADRGEVPVGAVVVCRDRIIARSHNLTETLNDVTAHAEMQAITAAANTLGGKYLNECTLYVTVEPCVMCAGAIAWAQTGKLVFGAEDEIVIEMSDNKRLAEERIATFDGEISRKVITGDRIVVRRSEKVSQFIKTNKLSFLQRIRNKM